MPLLTIKASDGPQAIGPLTVTTDFQVKDGACLFATSNPGANLNDGFDRIANSDRSDWQAGVGKTVYVWTKKRATVYYEALV